MTWPSFNKNLQNQHGFVLVWAGLAVILGLVGALSVEAGNLYVTRVKLQAAVDAAAVAGGTFFPKAKDANDVVDLANKVGNFNLTQAQMDGTVVSQVIQNDPTVPARLTVNGSANAHIMFLSALIPSAQKINTKATVEQTPAAVSLVLDISTPMNTVDANGASRIQALKDAAKSFVGEFSEQIDQVAVVSFNRWVNPALVQNMQPLKKDIVKTFIDSLTVDDGQNLTDGLVEARRQIERQNFPSAVYKTIVVFTDGLPSNLCVTFRHFRTGFGNGNGNGNDIGGGAGNGGSDFYCYYANPLDRRGSLYLPEAAADPTFDFPFDNPLFRPRCSNGYDSSVLVNCLNDIQYLDSENQIQGNNVGSLDLSSNENLYHAFYDQSIIEADRAKAESFVVYTVGLGTPSANTGDAYNDLFRFDGGINPFLLRRLANDPGSVSDPPFPNLPLNAAYPQGRYLQTPQNEDIKNLMLYLASQIKKVKLTE